MWDDRHGSGRADQSKGLTEGRLAGMGLNIGRVDPVSSNYNSDSEDAHARHQDLYHRDAVIPDMELLEHMDESASMRGSKQDLRALRTKPQTTTHSHKSPKHSKRPKKDANLVRELAEEENLLLRSQRALRPVDNNVQKGKEPKQKRVVPHPDSGDEGHAGMPLVGTTKSAQERSETFLVQLRGQENGLSNSTTVAARTEPPAASLRQPNDGLSFPSLVECNQQASHIIKEVERFKAMNASKVPLIAAEELMKCYKYLRSAHHDVTQTKDAGDKTREIMILEMERIKEAHAELQQHQAEQTWLHSQNDQMKDHDEERDKLANRLQAYEQQQRESFDHENEMNNILQVCEEVLRNSKEHAITLESQRVSLVAALSKKEDELQQLHELVQESRKSMVSAQTAGAEMVTDKQRELESVITMLEESGSRVAEVTAKLECTEEIVGELQREIRVLESSLSDKDCTVEAMRAEIMEKELHSSELHTNLADEERKRTRDASERNNRYNALAYSSSSSLQGASNTIVYAKFFGKLRIYSTATALQRLLHDRKDRFEKDLQAAWKDQDTAVGESTRLETELEKEKNARSAERERLQAEATRMENTLRTKLKDAEGTLATIREDLSRKYDNEIHHLKAIVARNERALKDGETWFDKENVRTSSENRDLKTRLRTVSAHRDDLLMDAFTLKQSLSHLIITSNEMRERTLLEQIISTRYHECKWNAQLKDVEAEVTELLSLKLDEVDYAQKRHESVSKKKREDEYKSFTQRGTALDKGASALRLEQNIALEKQTTQSLDDGKRDLISGTTSRLKEIVERLEEDRKRQADALLLQISVLVTERDALLGETARIPPLEAALAKQTAVADQLAPTQAALYTAQAEHAAATDLYEEVKPLADRLPIALQTLADTEALVREVRCLHEESTQQLEVEVGLREQRDTTIAGLQAVIVETEGNLTVMRQERNTHQQLGEQMKVDLEGYSERLIACKAELSQLGDEHEAVKHSLHVLERKHLLLVDGNKALMKEKEAENLAHHTKHNELQERLSAVSGELHVARDELETMLRKLRETEDEVVTKTALSERLGESLQELRGHFEALSAEHTELLADAARRETTERGVKQITQLHAASTELRRSCYSRWRLFLTMRQRAKYQRTQIAPHLLQKMNNALRLHFFRVWTDFVVAARKEASVVKRNHEDRSQQQKGAFLLEAYNVRSIRARYFARWESSSRAAVLSREAHRTAALLQSNYDQLHDTLRQSLLKERTEEKPMVADTPDTLFSYDPPASVPQTDLTPAFSQTDLIFETMPKVVIDPTEMVDRVNDAVFAKTHEAPARRSTISSQIVAEGSAALTKLFSLRHYFSVLRLRALQAKYENLIATALSSLSPMVGECETLEEAVEAVKGVLGGEGAKSVLLVQSAKEEVMGYQQKVRQLEDEIARQRLEIGWKNNRIKLMQRSSDTLSAASDVHRGSSANSTPLFKPSLRPAHRVASDPKTVTIPSPNLLPAPVVCHNKSLSPPRPSRPFR